jgi:hypothetical protein
MRVKCLGKPTPPHDIRIITNIPRPDYEDNKVKQEPTFSIEYFELGSKRYAPTNNNGEIEKSKEFSEEFIKQSETEPQPIGEISNKQIKTSSDGRLWLYKEKMFELDRNDYEREKVKFLILNFLEKERIIFEKLRLKYKT